MGLLKSRDIMQVLINEFQVRKLSDINIESFNSSRHHRIQITIR